MKRGLIGGLLAAVSLVSGSAAASGGPVLRSAVALQGHVVVTVAVAELVPGRVEVATSPRTDSSGAFPAGSVKLRETIIAHPGTTGVVRWQTRNVVPRGTYYVVVSGLLAGGVTTCLPLRGRGICLERWSNVRRIVVR